jgi:very-short-patch-repair endonuclease
MDENIDQNSLKTDENRFELEIIHDNYLNYAMQHNGVPLIRQIQITNHGEKCENLNLIIEFSPSVVETFEIIVDEIDTDSTFIIDSPLLKVDGNYISNLVEKESCDIVFSIIIEDKTVFTKSILIEVLAFNEWNGLTSLPQLIASFVLPNHPAINEVLSLIRTGLEKATNNPDLTGYCNANPQRIKKITEAVYASLNLLNISYAVHPPGFENSYQKIRLPEQILQTQMGNCIDLSLFCAGIMELAGLNPFIFILKEHAFTGCWTIRDKMPQGATDNILRIKKLVEIGEIVVFDPTCGVGLNPVDFEKAESIAVNQLEKLIFAVDIQASREERINPLPSRIIINSFKLTEKNSENIGIAKEILIKASKYKEGVPGFQEELSSVEKSKPLENRRISKWKEKLLDLSLRNKLLNYRETKTTLQILCADIATLEDALAQGNEFVIFPKTKKLTQDDPRNAELVEKLSDKNSEFEALVEAQANHQLFSTCTEMQLEKRLKEMARAARVGLEEGGANTLFLALGFLKWFDTNSSTTERMAPLVLIPVELTRPSARYKYKLKIFEDESRVNISLIEKLRKDFGIDLSNVAENPTDDFGLDLPSILKAFKSEVARMDEWEVIEKAGLGIFSFTKFLMWRDLDAKTDDLLSNEVVNHLALSGRKAFPAQGEFPKREELDHLISPKDNFCPLDSDSSQLTAIIAASQKKSFIIEGPPGTGKSQTITNLITHCLGEGKSILFVSEKMAALEVVKKRLEKVGMGPFCLELHSNKTKKKQIIEDLGLTLNLLREKPPQNWEKTTNELLTKREKINNYIQEVHKKRGPGISYFSTISNLVKLNNLKVIDLDFGNSYNDISSENFDDFREKISEFSVKAEEIGDILIHPFNCSLLTKWSPSLNKSIEKNLNTLLENLEDLKNNLNVFSILSATPDKPDFQTLDCSGNLIELLHEPPKVTEEILKTSHWNKTKSDLKKWVDDEKLERNLSSDLENIYEKEIYSIELDEIQKKVEYWSTRFFIFAFFALFFTRLKLKKLCKKLPPNKKLNSDLLIVKEVVVLRENIKEKELSGKRILGDLDENDEIRWGNIEEIIDWTGKFKNSLQMWVTLPNLFEDKEKHENHLISIVSSIDRNDPPVKRYAEKIQKFKNARDNFSKTKTLLENELSLKKGWDINENEDYIEFLNKKTDLWLNSLPKLRSWSIYLLAQNQINELGFENLTIEFSKGKIKSSQLPAYFDLAFYSWLSEKITNEVQLLGEFHSGDHERVIEQFKTLDKKLLKLSEKAVKAKLSSNIPLPNDNAPASSEIGFLMREMKKKRRHKSLRVLFQNIPQLLRRLKPCFLMSPLSVAQYIDPSWPTFDLVVFDEASQIPVHDSIGAIARGDQLIVVGDSKQLPPTSFFNRVDDEEIPDDDDIDELESILDECIAARLPHLELSWHYRSRHENLITFSNYNYYNNSLHTFPSQRKSDPHMGIEFRHIENGFYDKGKTRTNKKEAEEVVNEVVKRLLDPVEQKRSIGIVTFSVAQQTLIEDLLEEARKENENIEDFFGAKVMEPVFIKNLENVQGDERDVMLFSVCYGPDQNGKISMNFGPLNRDGGERRLNVAVTRAREKMIVFSSLLKEHIDLRRTNALGAKHLRMFLDYAQRGPSAISMAGTLKKKEDSERIIENSIKVLLENEGFEVHSQIGCSGYRIDLAIVDPENREKYLLGIECDGYYYYSAKTARDRDRLRKQVLEGLGWKLIRIWSTNWWIDSKGELNKIKEVIESIRKNKNDNLKLNNANGLVKIEKIEKDVPVKLMKEFVKKPIGKPYEIYTNNKTFGDNDDFYLATTKKTLKAELKKIMTVEAPIFEKLLAKRVSDLFNLKRITKKVLNHIEQVMDINSKNSNYKKVGDFYWLKNQDCNKFNLIRVASVNEKHERSIEEIPIIELTNGAIRILEENLSLEKQDLIKETLKLFGISRLTKNNEKYLNEAVELLISKNSGEIENDRISIVKP